MSDTEKSQLTREEVEAFLDDPTLVATHFGEGILIGVVEDGYGWSTVVTDGVATSYSPAASKEKGISATTRLALLHIIRHKPIFGGY